MLLWVSLSSGEVQEELVALYHTPAERAIYEGAAAARRRRSEPRRTKMVKQPVPTRWIVVKHGEPWWNMVKLIIFISFDIRYISDISRWNWGQTCIEFLTCFGESFVPRRAKRRMKRSELNFCSCVSGLVQRSCETYHRSNPRLSLKLFGATSRWSWLVTCGKNCVSCSQFAELSQSPDVYIRASHCTDATASVQRIITNHDTSGCFISIVCQSAHGLSRFDHGSGSHFRLHGPTDCDAETESAALLRRRKDACETSRAWLLLAAQRMEMHILQAPGHSSWNT